VDEILFKPVTIRVRGDNERVWPVYYEVDDDEL